MSVTSSHQAATVEQLVRPPATTVEPGAHLAAADGRDLGETRIRERVDGNPVSVDVTGGVREAAELMPARSVAHLPMVRGGGLVGVVDMSDICRALL